MTTFNNLNDAIDAIINDIIEDDVKKTAIDLHKDLVQNSPVDTGDFRGDWQVDVNGKTAEITNNKEYAQKLADGHSKQAPAGWIDAAIDKASRF